MKMSCEEFVRKAMDWEKKFEAFIAKELDIGDVSVLCCGKNGVHVYNKMRWWMAQGGAILIMAHLSLKQEEVPEEIIDTLANLMLSNGGDDMREELERRYRG
jgi:hypothetical protein